MRITKVTIVFDISRLKKEAGDVLVYNYLAYTLDMQGPDAK